MKKWLFLICVSFSLTSCSYLTNFYIFNTTEETITLTYKTKKAELNHPFVTAPKIFTFKTYEQIEKEEIKNPAIQVKDSLTLQAMLQPKQALWIGVDRNFNLNYDEELLKENVAYLTIKNGLTTTEYTAIDLVTQFKEYTYEIVGIAVE